MNERIKELAKQAGYNPFWSTKADKEQFFDLEEFANEDDFPLELKGVNLLIDSISMSYLNGVEVDYKEDLIGSSFSITNPNAQTSCGCGSSFSV